MDAVRLMPPVNPGPGVTVIVDVFAVSAPGETVTAVPLIVNVGGGGVTEI